MFHSLRTRITLISLLSGVVIASGLILSGAQIISGLISDNLITHARLAAKELVSQINRLRTLGLEFDDIIDFDEQVRSVIAKDSNIAFAGIYDGHGSLRFKSGHFDLKWSPSEATILDANHQEKLINTETYLIVVRPIAADGDMDDGYAAIGVDRALLYEATFKSVRYFIIIASILVFLSLTIHFAFLKRSVIEPLGRLVRAVKAVNPANFNGMLQGSNVSNTEIGELAQAFTKLLSQLAEARNETLAQAVRAISAEKKLNRTIVESSPLAIYTRDKEGRITGWNKACEQMFGWKEEEVLGKLLPTIPQTGKSESDALRDLTLENEQIAQVELQRHRKDGSLIYVMTSFSPLYDESGAISGYLTIAADITRRKAAEQKIEFMAHHDALTHLPNRLLLEERFKQAVALANEANHLIALLFIDLDNFKSINDSFGHSMGDAYLKEIAHRLSSCVRTTDTICRQGGDEFLIVLNGISQRDDILPILSKLKQHLREPVLIEGHELGISMSIGVSMYPQDGTSFDELLKKSDMAMYQAKGEGKNTYRFFDLQLVKAESSQHKLKMDLQYALEKRQLVLHYQPQIDLRSGMVSGTEALIRWNHPEYGLILPSEFIPIAEESGLIISIGKWAIHEACRQAAAWKEEGLEALTMSVNVSVAQLKNHELEGTILAALRESRLEARCLELELTESILIHDVAFIQNTIRRLKEIGVKISIDDFGVGYSSLSYLKRLDTDKLKIDRSFVLNLANDTDDQAIVQAIIHMAKSLKLATIAEGVEDPATLRYLQEMQCDQAQGFYFAKAMPASEFKRFILSNSSMFEMVMSEE